MKHLIIIAAGGFGRETYCSATEAIGYGTEFDVKGFLDDNPNALDGYEGYPPIIGTPDDYVPQEEDVFQCAVGSVKTRRELSEKILAKGGEFLTLIHKTAYLSKNVKVGKGCMILAGARIQCDAKVGDYVIMQPYAILGHDVQVGNWSLINALADCGGMSKVGEMCTINTTAFILPLSKIEDGATVGAESLVLRKVKAGQTVMGVPAKPLVVPQMKKPE